MFSQTRIFNEKHKHKEQYNRKCNHKVFTITCIACSRRPSRDFRFRFVRNSMPSHQKSVAVNHIRCACKKGHQILSFLHKHRLKIRGLHSQNLVDLICEHPFDIVVEKDVAFSKFVELTEELRRRKTPVRRDNRMCVLAADRKTRTLKVSCSLLQNVFARSGVHRQVFVYLWNFNVPDFFSDFEHLRILSAPRFFLFGKRVRHSCRVERAVVRVCKLEPFFQFRLVEFISLCIETLDFLGCNLPIIKLRNDGIYGNQKSQKKDPTQNKIPLAPFLFRVSLVKYQVFFFFFRHILPRYSKNALVIIPVSRE